MNEFFLSFQTLYSLLTSTLLQFMVQRRVRGRSSIFDLNCRTFTHVFAYAERIGRKIESALPVALRFGLRMVA